MIKQQYNQHKETIHNFIWRSLQIFGKQGITFLIFILCAKMLTPYDFGIYNYALAIIFFLIMFGDFGISTATSKYVAEYNVTNKNKLKSVLFNSGIIILGLTILITILTLIIGPWYLKDKYVYVLYLLPLIFLAPMTSLYDGIYRGLKRFKSLAIISVIIGLVSIPMVYYLIKLHGLTGALIAQGLFYLILLVGLAFFYREFHFKLNKEVMKEIGKYSLIIGLSTLGYFLFSRISILILGYFNFINEIGIYELLNKIFMILIMPLIILGNILFPNFVLWYKYKEYKKILYKFKRYSITFFFIAFIFAIFSLILIPKFIEIFFNEYYQIEFIKIFLPVTLIYSLQVYCAVISSSMIIATGQGKMLSWSNIIAGPINLILSLLLLKSLGYIGVIYSILILHIFMILITHYLFYKEISKLDKKQNVRT